MKEDNLSKPKWYIGIGTLCVVLVYLFFAALPIEQLFGIWGLIITELVILALALLPVIIFKLKLSEIMPVKKPKLRQLAAIVLLYIASYIVVLTVTTTLGYFFPQAFQVSEELNEFIVSAPFVLSFIAAAIMPGICEEALHRGLILHTLPKHKNQIVTMLIMAALFGLFHLDVYRFLPTAILGFILTYIMVKTENILMPMIFHILNNAVSVIMSHSMWQSAQEAGAQVDVIPETIGVFLILAAITPGLFYAAGRLIKKTEKSKKAKYAAIIMTIALIIGGVCVVGVSAALNPSPVISFTQTDRIIN